MSAIPALFAESLLVLAVVWARPAGPVWTRRRLLIQAGLLCLCLLAHAVLDRTLLPIACVLVLLVEAAVLLLRDGNQPDGASAAPPALWPLLAGMLAAWLAYRLLPSPAPAATAAALGIVLCGMVALLAARQRHAQLAALLTAGHGLLLFVGTVPGPGWPALLMATLPQAAVLAMVCARPAWSDQIGVDER